MWQTFVKLKFRQLSTLKGPSLSWGTFWTFQAKFQKLVIENILINAIWPWFSLTLAPLSQVVLLAISISDDFPEIDTFFSNVCICWNSLWWKLFLGHVKLALPTFLYFVVCCSLFQPAPPAQHVFSTKIVRVTKNKPNWRTLSLRVW